MAEWPRPAEQPAKPTAGGGRGGGSFRRNVFTVAGGTALAQGIGLAAAPALTRLYTPADFGALALFGAILTWVVTVASLRLHLAIPLPKNDDDAMVAAQAALAALLVTTVLVAGTFALTASQIAERMQAPALARYWWLLPVSFCGAGLSQIATAWATRERAFRTLAATKVTQVLAQISVQLVAGWMALGAPGLLVGDALGRTGGTVAIARRAWQVHQARLRRWNARAMAEMVRRYREFPLVSTWSALINSGGLQVAPLLVATYHQAEDVGQLSLATRAIAAPMQIVGLAVSQVFLESAARLARDNPAHLRIVYRRTALRLALLAAAPSALIVLVGPELFSWVFGPAWREAGIYGRILAPALWLQFVASPLSQTLIVIEAQRTQLAWDILRLGSVAGAIVLAATAGNPRVTVFAYALALALSYAGLLVLTDRRVGRAAAAAR